MRIDVSENSMLNPLYQYEYSDINRKCHFYYDETNNHRKFWLDRYNFNASIKEDFVLGGVFHYNDFSNADVSKLKSIVRLQKTAKEIKFHHLIKKGDDFFSCLNRIKVRQLLEWLSETDLYIHFSNINNFYYGLVDIVDTVCADTDTHIIFYYQMERLMKNELYKLAMNYYDEFYNYLNKYSFPNIKSTDVYGFCDELIGFIERYDNYNSNFEIECLRQLLKQARKKEKLLFLQGNKENTIIDNYYLFYLNRIATFKNSFHTFDEETMVQSEFDDIELFDGEIELDNFEFVESSKNELVQISDCIVGLLGKFYIWINNIDFDYIRNLDKNLNEYQKDTLLLLAQLIKKSEDECIFNIHSIESIEENKKCFEILKFALEYGNKKKIRNFIKNKNHQ